MWVAVHVRPLRYPVNLGPAHCHHDTRVARKQATQVGGEIRRPVARLCPQELSRGGHPGEHEQGRRARPDGGLDVGVETVADDQRKPGPAPADRLLVHRTLRLSGHHRIATGGGAQHCDQRTVAGHQATLGRHRRIDIARDPERAGPDRECGLGEPGVVKIWIKALDDGDGLLPGGRHRP